MERLLLCALLCLPGAFDAADARHANLPGRRAATSEAQPSPDASSSCLQGEEHRRGRDRSGEWRICGPAAAAPPEAQVAADLPRWTTDGSPEANASCPAGGEASEPNARDSYDYAYWGYMLLFVLLLLATLGCCCFCLASGRWPLTTRLRVPRRDRRQRKTGPPLLPQSYGAVEHTASPTDGGRDSSPLEESSPLGQGDALPSASSGGEN